LATAGGACPPLGWRDRRRTRYGRGPTSRIDPLTSRGLRGLYYETALAGSCNSCCRLEGHHGRPHSVWTDWPRPPSPPWYATSPTYLTSLTAHQRKSSGMSATTRASPFAIAIRSAARRRRPRTSPAEEHARWASPIPIARQRSQRASGKGLTMARRPRSNVHRRLPLQFPRHPNRDALVARPKGLTTASRHCRNGEPGGGTSTRMDKLEVRWPFVDFLTWVTSAKRAAAELARTCQTETGRRRRRAGHSQRFGVFATTLHCRKIRSVGFCRNTLAWTSGRRPGVLLMDQQP